MEGCQSVVSDGLKVGAYMYIVLFSLSCCVVYITVGRNSVVITLLVLSILVWIVSAILTVIGVIFALVTKEVSLKHRNLFKFQFLLRWMKITYVVLLVIEFPFLLIVFVFWIAFSVILDNPNS